MSYVIYLVVYAMAYLVITRATAVTQVNFTKCCQGRMGFVGTLLSPVVNNYYHLLLTFVVLCKGIFLAFFLLVGIVGRL